MPAATAEKRARQRANKLMQTESATIPVTLPAQTPEIVSLPAQLTNSTPSFTIPAVADEPATWPTPAPSKFTISYTPLSITYPEPPNPAAKLPTDAVRVTREQLTLMLHQSYIHGSEHGWKANVVIARERLQAEYEKDMEDATTKFAEHEKQVTEALNTQYKEQLQQALTDMFEREQERRDEEYVHAFELGRAAGIQDECEYRESAHKPQIDVGIQVGPTTTAVSIQTSPCFTPTPSFATISTQTESPTYQNLEIVPPTFVDVSPSPAVTENRKSAQFSAKRERSPLVTISGSSTPALAVSEPIAPHAIVSAPEAAEIVQKYPETRKSHVSTQKHPELPILTRFSWADDAASLPTLYLAPTKHPRDLSGLPIFLHFTELGSRPSPLSAKSHIEINGMGSPQFFLFKMTAKGLRNEDVA
ncbi:hypothetical protein BYT27DRAFT_7283429 [Phlegmacium glaucopus]|nr:hypothetical protein BYT27DRAFT_7283429 [Phlegmacium glaucopus]